MASSLAPTMRSSASTKRDARPPRTCSWKAIVGSPGPHAQRFLAVEASGAPCHPTGGERDQRRAGPCGSAGYWLNPLFGYFARIAARSAATTRAG